MMNISSVTAWPMINVNSNLAAYTRECMSNPIFVKDLQAYFFLGEM